MPELAAGRFFETYGASMDAALEAKARDIEPWLAPGLVVDRGCGTGALMRYLAAQNRKVVGIDLSEELSRTHAGVILANIMDPVFADGFVENIILSSVMHEVYTYQQHSLAAVTICLSNCARELCPGGRIIIRDMWAPEPGPPVHTLTFDAETWPRFENFRARFPGPVEAVDQGGRTVQLSTRTAVEFLSKKDYRLHWELELREVYCSVPLSVYEEIARTLRLRLVHAAPVRNDWIVANRWAAGVTGDLPAYTNQLIVLEKPARGQGASAGS